jgi:hypothetical protein
MRYVIPGRTATCYAGMVTMLSIGAAAQARAQEAVPVLQCQVRYMSDTVSIEAEPTSNPYAVAAHDIGGRFRFKAVLVGDAGLLEHVALYAYDMEAPGAPVLIHEVVHKPPFAADRPIPALTGWNHVYSARLGREMVYGCALGTRPRH